MDDVNASYPSQPPDRENNERCRREFAAKRAASHKRIVERKRRLREAARDRKAIDPRALPPLYE